MPASPDAYRLNTFMQRILDTTVTVFNDFGVSLPTKQYWTTGTAVIDCEQVVASLVQMYLGRPGDQADEPQRLMVPRTAVVTLAIARTVPTVGQNGRPPDAAKIQQYASAVAVDAWILVDSVTQFDQWDANFGVGVIATVDIADPEGGLQVVNMNLTMAVP